MFQGNKEQKSSYTALLTKCSMSSLQNLCLFVLCYCVCLPSGLVYIFNIQAEIDASEDTHVTMTMGLKKKEKEKDR